MLKLLKSLGEPNLKAKILEPIILKPQNFQGKIFWSRNYLQKKLLNHESLSKKNSYSRKFAQKNF